MENSTPSSNNNTEDVLSNVDKTVIPKKAVKPPKIEDKPFNEFITKYFILCAK